jgi:uncharacterized protein (DUF2267 family)
MKKEALKKELQSLGLKVLGGKVKVKDVKAMLAAYAEPKEVTASPYKFTDQKSQKEALRQYVDDNLEWMYEYETKHEDAGGNYLDAFANEISVKGLKNLNMSHNDVLVAVKETMAAGLSESEINEILKDIVTAEPHGVEYPDNVVFTPGPIGEIEVQLSGLYGSVNGKDVDDVFKVLSEGLSDDDLKEVSDEIKNGYWDHESDLAYADASYQSWMFVVDVDEFIERANELLADKGKPEIK